MYKKIFIIGPGGAGKSTVGTILARLTGYKIIDLDDEFCLKINNIRLYIKEHGYESYLMQNSFLLEKIIDENRNDNAVIVLSSGFLSTDTRADLVKKNKEMVTKNGVSILILPSENFEITQKCIVGRQLSRGYGNTKEKETLKINQRFNDYIKMGDFQIFSQEEPETIARKIFIVLQQVAVIPS